AGHRVSLPGHGDYYDRPSSAPMRSGGADGVVGDQSGAGLGCPAAVARIELMTTHDLAKREKQKLELLRSLLTYFHYASKETRPDVFRSEIDRINRAAAETQDRWRARQVEVPTEVSQRSEGQGPQPTRIPAG
ncbi:hypothetical exported protein, partial [Mycobacterium tuberculosis T17]